MRPSSVEAFFFFVLLILVCPDGAYPLWVKPFFLLGRDFVCLVCWLRLAQPEPQPSRWRPAVSWRLCRLETARALWVLCRLGWGVSLAGKTYFSFVGKRSVFYLAVGFCLLGWGVPLAGKPPFHLPARRGPKPLFLLIAKEKAVLDSEKEKVDQWK